METILSAPNALSYALLVVLIPTAILYAAEYWLRFSHDSREPTRISPKFPLIGHLVSFGKQGQSYHGELYRRRTSGERFFSLPLLGTYKVYVLNTVQLIKPVQRSARALTLDPLHAIMAKKFAGASPESIKHYKVACEGGEKEENIIQDMHKTLSSSMTPGPDLDFMNFHMGIKLTGCLEKLEWDAGSPKGFQTGLYDLVKDMVTLASSQGVYGPDNPFVDKDVQELFWTFESNLPRLSKGYPSYLTQSAIQAREKFADRFVKYYEAGSHEKGSKLVRARHDVLLKYNFPLHEIGKFEMITATGLLSNSVPTVFRFLIDVFSRPSLVKELRDEVSRVVTKDEAGGESRLVMDVVRLRTECKLMLSTFQETQRAHTRHATTRKVVQDTSMDGGKILLKEGNYLQIPSETMHHNPAIWGSNVDEYDPERFIKMANKPQSEQYKNIGGAQGIPTGAYLAWGIAPHICPGRHFITTELVIMTAMLLLRFDIEPVAGAWSAPEPDKTRLLAILPPKKDVDVRLKIRDEWQGSWALELGSSRFKLPLASG